MSAPQHLNRSILWAGDERAGAIYSRAPFWPGTASLLVAAMSGGGQKLDLSEDQQVVLDHRHGRMCR